MAVSQKTAVKSLGLWGGLVLLVLGLGVGLAAWLVLGAPPGWVPPDPQNPQTLQLAQRVENFVTTQTTRVRGHEQPWSIELSQEQANAWLAARLPMWLANQSVDEKFIRAATPAMVHLGDGQVEWALRTDWAGRPLVLRARFEPVQAAESSPAGLKLTAIYAGRMPIPRDLLAGQLRRYVNPGDADRFLRAMDNLALRLTLADGRSVQVQSLTLKPGAVVLTCRTLGPGQ